VTRRRDGTASRARFLGGLALTLIAGCAAPRIVPVPAAGVQVDPTQGIASVAAEGVELAVRPSAWRDVPRDLPDYVTPFLVSLVNGAALPVEYDYPDVRLFDEFRFQYTALPPIEVERILRGTADGEVRLAAFGSTPPILRRRAVPDAPDWWWTRSAWSGWPWYYPWPWYYYPWFPAVGDVYRRALPMGVLQPGARLEGFVYFPQLRPGARALTLEFHHRLGELPRVLSLAFEVERDKGKPPDG